MVRRYPMDAPMIETRSLVRVAAPALALVLAALAAACSPVAQSRDVRIERTTIATPTSMNRAAEERWFEQATYGED